MKNIFIIICMAIFLTGCDKLNDIVGRIKEKSPWVYSEEVDKLNNTKIFVAKKNYKNKEGTAQADTEFQCDSRKELWLQISTFEANPVNGKLPGTALMLNKGETKITSAFEYIKTRNGDAKIALYAIADENYGNSAKSLLSGFNLDELKKSGGQGLGLAVLIDELSAVLRNQGYVLAADKKEIPNLFKNKDWIVEIPTQSGVVIAEIDLSNQEIKKVFEACSWKPEFLNTVAPTAAPQASAAAKSADLKSAPVDKKASSAINDDNIVAFVTANLTSEDVVVNQPLSLAIRGNLMTANGDFKFLHSYSKTQLPNKLQNVFILCVSSSGIGKLANEATAIVKADKFVVTGVSPNGDEFRISADKCEITSAGSNS